LQFKYKVMQPRIYTELFTTLKKLHYKSKTSLDIYNNSEFSK